MPVVLPSSPANFARVKNNHEASRELLSIASMTKTNGGQNGG
jgi:hypothetical protein